MKDLFEALKIRLRSPVFGYFGLTLIAFNWHAFFYLFVQKGDVSARIAYFEANTTLSSLVIWPIVFSIAYAVLSPWLICIIAWLTAKPIELRSLLQVNSEHRLLLRQKELEDIRSKMLASAEQELIERAQRDQTVDELENEDLRNRVKADLEQLRTERDLIKTDPSSLIHQHNQLMDIASTYRNKANDSSSTLSDRETFRNQARGLEERAYKLLQKAGITSDSQEIAP